MKATKQRDGAHARIYSSWLSLPTWRALSAPARALLIEILATFRPGENSRLRWSARRAGDALGCSKSTGARCLLELERNGWLSVVQVTAFGGSPKASAYRLEMFPCDVTFAPATRAFAALPGERLAVDRKRKPCPQSHGKDKDVPPMTPHGFTGRTRQSHRKDKANEPGAPVSISDALKKTSIFAANHRKATA